MPVAAIAAVGLGAAFGAWLRWALGGWLNPILPPLPLGTLAANLAGGYIIGFAISYFADHGSLPPEVRLFVITGFLGALTTFSTFSAESTALLLRGQYAWFTAHLVVHLTGSIGMTVLGIASWNALRG